MVLISAGSSILAMILVSAPHFSQVSISILNTRFNRFARSLPRKCLKSILSLTRHLLQLLQRFGFIEVRIAKGFNIGDLYGLPDTHGLSHEDK